MAPPRVGVFLDTANLYHSAKHLFQQNVNFPAILGLAREFGEPTVRHAYVIRSEEGKEENFFKALTKAGFVTREKDLQVYAGGVKKGDWDVGITVDIVRELPALDLVVLGSGDGDFLPLVEFIKAHDRRVVVVAFSRSASAKLKEAADTFIDLGASRDRFLLVTRR